MKEQKREREEAENQARKAAVIADSKAEFKKTPDELLARKQQLTASEGVVAHSEPRAVELLRLLKSPCHF